MYILKPIQYSLVVVHIYLQQKHEEYQRAKRQKEDEELQRKKLKQREKVSLIYYSIVMLMVEILTKIMATVK